MKFFVYGDPITQGSKTAFVNRRTGKAIITEQGAVKLKPWRQDIAEIASQHADEPLTGPVEVVLHFYVAKPKSAPKGKLYSDKRPDIDKLTRAVLDALTGIAFQDDGQVAVLTARKYYEAVDAPRGVEIQVSSLLSV